MATPSRRSTGRCSTPSPPRSTRRSCACGRPRLVATVILRLAARSATARPSVMARAVPAPMGRARMVAARPVLVHRALHLPLPLALLSARRCELTASNMLVIIPSPPVLYRTCWPDATPIPSHLALVPAYSGNATAVSGKLGGRLSQWPVGARFGAVRAAGPPALSGCH